MIFAHHMKSFPFMVFWYFFCTYILSCVNLSGYLFYVGMRDSPHCIGACTGLKISGIPVLELPPPVLAHTYFHLTFAAKRLILGWNLSWCRFYYIYNYHVRVKISDFRNDFIPMHVSSLSKDIHKLCLQFSHSFWPFPIPTSCMQ